MSLTQHPLLRARSGHMTGELHQIQDELGNLPSRLKPESTAVSICGFCSTGCSLRIHLNGEGQAVNLTPNRDYPVNLGMACPKGWEALTPLTAGDRATTPLLLNRSTGKHEPISWAEALRVFTSRFKAIVDRHGSESLSFLSTGQIATEEMALLGALAKFGMGMKHVDSNTRQCMATAHVAYKQSFGFDAPPFTYADFEESDVLVFVGANPCIAHPIMWQRVKRNRNNPAIIVVDPRRSETAMQATLHVAPYPKSDIILLYGLARELISLGRVDRAFVTAHTQGFDAFSEFVSEYTLQKVERETGIPMEQTREMARQIAEGARVSFWWTMGVNQSHQSTRTAQALINLALMTGNIGRPGTGANSITGQCNAMGSRLFGNATSLIGGYDFASANDRDHVAKILGIDPRRIPAERSLAYDQILDGVDEGSIRGLWVIATNTAHSWVNHGHFAKLREKLDFLVVQDMYVTTETARLADLILPAAGWGEKEGVFINSERRFGVIRNVSKAPGDALSDFRIFQLIAHAWGCGELFSAWSSPERAFGLLRELSRGQPYDFTGIRGYDHIESCGGIQWPFPEGSADLATERRLFTDGRFYTEDQRAVFHFDAPQGLPEPTDTEYPLLLLTGRSSSAQWHTGTRTDKSAILRKLASRSHALEIHPIDADRLGVEPGATVSIVSRRGRADAVAHVTEVVSPGQIYMGMHSEAVNRLTFPAFDPHSRQPAYKACAVRVEPKRTT